MTEGRVPSQAEVLAWVAERWPAHVTPVWRAVKVGEEAGEVLGAVIKADLGIKRRSAIRTETAQLIVCAMALAEAEGFDWQEAVADEWQDMASRVWTKDGSPDV